MSPPGREDGLYGGRRRGKGVTEGRLPLASCTCFWTGSVLKVFCGIRIFHHDGALPHDLRQSCTRGYGGGRIILTKLDLTPWENTWFQHQWAEG